MFTGSGPSYRSAASAIPTGSTTAPFFASDWHTFYVKAVDDRGEVLDERWRAQIADIVRTGQASGEFTATEYRGSPGLQALADEVAVLRPREIVLAVVAAIVLAFYIATADKQGVPRSALTGAVALIAVVVILVTVALLGAPTA